MCVLYQGGQWPSPIDNSTTSCDTITCNREDLIIQHETPDWLPIISVERERQSLLMHVRIHIIGLIIPDLALSFKIVANRFWLCPKSSCHILNKMTVMKIWNNWYILFRTSFRKIFQAGYYEIEDVLSCSCIICVDQFLQSLLLSNVRSCLGQMSIQDLLYMLRSHRTAINWKINLQFLRRSWNIY